MTIPRAVYDYIASVRSAAEDIRRCGASLALSPETMALLHDGPAWTAAAQQMEAASIDLQRAIDEASQHRSASFPTE